MFLLVLTRFHRCIVKVCKLCIQSELTVTNFELIVDTFYCKLFKNLVCTYHQSQNDSSAHHYTQFFKKETQFPIDRKFGNIHCVKHTEMYVPFRAMIPFPIQNNLNQIARNTHCTLYIGHIRDNR